MGLCRSATHCVVQYRAIQSEQEAKHDIQLKMESAAKDDVKGDTNQSIKLLCSRY